MSSSFPLLNIPLIPRLEVIKNMKLAHVLRLSDCSRRMHRIVRTARIQPDEILVSFVENRMDIYLRHSVEEFVLDVTTESNVREVMDQEWIGADGMRTLGSSAHVCKLYKVYSQDGDFSEACRRVIGNLLELFLDRMLDVYVSPRHLTNGIWRHVKSLRSVFVWKFVERRLTAADIRFLMGLEVRRYQTIEAEVEEGVEHTEGFKATHLYVSPAPWVHLDAVLNSRCRKIRLDGIQMPSASQLNALLKQWVAKEKMENLNRLELSTADTPFAPGTLDKVLKDVANEPYDGSRMNTDTDLYIRYWDDGKTRDVRRVDGKVASVRVDERHFYLIIK